VPSDDHLKGQGRALEAALGEAVAAARQAHPAVAMDEAGFREHLARHVGARALQPGWMQSVRVGDLFLAFAALGGDKAALSILEERVLRPAAASARRVGKGGDFVDEVHQRLRERLLLPQGNRPPRLAEYAGAGALLAWATVAAVRVGLDLHRAAPDHGGDEEELEAIRGPDRDPEHSLIGRAGASALSRAFREAARTLTDEERVLLRYHFVDGLNFEQIAPIFQTHRSTVSRRIAASRKKLLEETRRLLRERFKVRTSEVSSLIREAKSRLDVSISGWLRSSQSR